MIRAHSDTAGQPGDIGADALNSAALAAISRLTSSISPMAPLLATLDWLGHLAMAPGRQAELGLLAMRQASELARQALRIPGMSEMEKAIGAGHGQAGGNAGAETSRSTSPRPRDQRFADTSWHNWPFDLIHQGYLMQENWWREAARNVPGVSSHNAALVAFGLQQTMEMLSPLNHPLTNPRVLQKTLESRGENLIRGFGNWAQDHQLRAHGKPPAGSDQFVVGRDLALTPGKVVMRNRLVELIQYSPSTDQVHPEPILIVPAWIMKYYILDLTPPQSLIRYLVEQGHSVFCISWKNPGPAEGDLGMDDYIRMGIMESIDAISAIAPQRAVHAAGYCLGGTLLAIAAAAMARHDDTRLASMTLFTAQTDFTEPGELSLFIDDSQITMLEAQMREQGVLEGGQMLGAFTLLKSNALLWGRMVDEYLLGERHPMLALMSWNADSTCMPHRMHSEYLRRLFLHNDLAENRYLVNGQAVSLRDVSVPIFCVATTTDHVAPWNSVYKLQGLTQTEITFVLTTGGHNVGIVNEPGNPRRQYQMRTRPENGRHVPFQDWAAGAQTHSGSWWPAWLGWLQERSGAPTAPPALGAPEAGFAVLGDAPGTYVFERSGKIGAQHNAQGHPHVS